MCTSCMQNLFQCDAYLKDILLVIIMYQLGNGTETTASQFRDLTLNLAFGWFGGKTRQCNLKVQYYVQALWPDNIKLFFIINTTVCMHKCTHYNSSY